jgi:hypothetical protein
VQLTYYSIILRFLHNSPYTVIYIHSPSKQASCNDCDLGIWISTWCLSNSMFTSTSWIHYCQNATGGQLPITRPTDCIATPRSRKSSSYRPKIPRTEWKLERGYEVRYKYRFLLKVPSFHPPGIWKEVVQCIDLRVMVVPYQIVMFGFGVILSHILVIHSHSPCWKYYLWWCKCRGGRGAVVCGFLSPAQVMNVLIGFVGDIFLN